MHFRNAKNILKHCPLVDTYKLLLASAMVTRPNYKLVWQTMLRPFVSDHKLTFRYRCYDKLMKGTLRFSDFSSDLLSIWELSVNDTYEIDQHFVPDLVVDAGGNIGLFTLRMAAAGHADVKFVIVEPLPRNVEQIKKHLDINGIDATILPSCMGGSRRSIPFYCREAIRSSFDPKEPYLSVMELPVLPLQDVIRASKVEAERILIKMDIEGMELETLRSYVPTEERAVYMVGELHNYAGESAELEELFLKRGWTVHFFEIADNYAQFRACSPKALPMIPQMQAVAAGVAA